MKRFFKFIIPLLLVALLIGSAVWYMFVYDRSTVRDFLTAQARNLAEDGHFDAATWLYGQSYKLSGEDQDIAIELAEFYKSIGNYTKAEYTLANAVADGGNAQLYIALCKTYVEQDKLLDAVNMLDNITDPAIKAELDALRPAVPVADNAPGLYSDYISLNITGEGGKLLVTTDGEYPSVENVPFNEAVTLSAGETRVYALCVAENGLVSPLFHGSYTVGGVVEPVTLQDRAIDLAVRSALMVAEGTQLYTNDLWVIESFTLPAEATSTDDLKHLTHLKTLNVEGQVLNSLSFLTPMTRLENLVLNGCSLPDDLETIGTLPMLKQLSMENCSLSTVSKLSGAVQLEKLDLSSNAIGDLSVLSGMPKLQELDLSHNAVTDLTPLSALSALVKLDVSYNSVASVAPLAGCIRLTELSISNNTVSDISILQVMPELLRFHASHNSLTDVSVLAKCVKLVELDISNNTVADISALSVLDKLTHLNFSHNAVKALPDFSKDSALVVINGERNQVESLQALKGLKHLNNIDMDYNLITDISFLADCPELVRIDAYGNKLGDISKLLERSIIVNYDPTA